MNAPCAPAWLVEFDKHVATKNKAAESDQAVVKPSTVPEPPGFAGVIARYLFASAARPLPEVAVASTLGLLAGLNGGAWSVSTPPTGLNLFVAVLALSGQGKEHLHSIHGLLAKVCELSGLSEVARTQAMNFINPRKAASGPALSRRLSVNPCHVNVAGEIGRLLKEMSNAPITSPLYGLLSLWIELYEKSGPNALIGGRDYADPTNNIQDVRGAAFSLLGEGNPDDFYGALTPVMLSNGALSRWTVVECLTTDKPPLNPSPVTEPDARLAGGLRVMVELALNQTGKPVPLRVHPEAQALLDQFERECTDKVNKAGRDEARRAIWNRAHIQVFRIAGNLAVADHCVLTYDHNLDPSRGPMPGAAIYAPHVEWARDLVLVNVKSLLLRLTNGDVGDGDEARERKVISLMKEYLTRKPSASYNVPDDMHAQAVLPLHYIQTRLSRNSAFQSHRDGPTRAIGLTLSNLCATGILLELNVTKAVEFATKGKLYRIMTIPDDPADHR